MNAPVMRKGPQWQPPPRPEWVKKLNDEGECMNISGVVPLDENSLLESARLETGLSDFGADDWHEPFQALLKALQDADLNFMGRIRLRCELLVLLSARLQIEDTYKRHPEIDDQQVVEPMLIVGQGRSGTSFLQNVLTANPDNAGLLQWEAMYPCPPPEKATYRSDPRIAKAEKLIQQWNRVTPTMESVHEFGALVPMEDCEILALNFMSPSWFGCFAQSPEYDAYMARQDPLLPLYYHRRVLKLLQWKNPRQHWVLKDVPHLDRMGPLLKIYPDACFIWPHRDPVRALASGISAIGTLQSTGSDHLFKAGSLEWISNPRVSAARFDAVIEQLKAEAVPPRQIYHLLYRDLVGDTMGSIEAMYRHFGFALSATGREGMAQYLMENPREARPPHNVAMTAEAIAEARAAYQNYQDYFGIPSE